MKKQTGNAPLDFNVGDLVQDEGGRKSYVAVPRGHRGDSDLLLVEYVDFNDGAGWKRDGEVPESYVSLGANRYARRYVYDLTLIERGSNKPKKKLPPAYALQYELDEDPIELYGTMAEVKARIQWLVENRSSLKKDKIFIYEIKNCKKVTVSTAIALKEVE